MAPAATAASTKCVALVVDASAFGRGVSTSCVTVRADASSSDVLVKSGHKVTFNPRYGDDFVCAIDGVPSGGCASTDDTHYWAYYHRAPGGSTWQISSEGAGTYRPPNGATDGWVYDDGSSTAPQPRNVPYRQICTQTAPSHAPATTPSAPRSTQTPATTAARAARPTGSAARAASPGSAPRTPAPRTSAPTTPSVSATSPATDTSSPARTGKPSTPAATSTAISAADPPSPPSHFPTAPVAGIVAALALGSAAAARMRRNR